MEAQTAIDTTPATTTESAPAAPATSAPDSAASTSERPQTARDLSAWMAKHDGADATPSTDAAASTDPAATVPATAPKDGTTNPTPDKGPIPFDVHSKALENARTKAVSEYREKFGWAESIPRETLTEFSSIASRMTSDPVGFLNTFASELSAHPVYGPQMRSNAARTLATRPAQTEPQPDVEIVDGSGQVTGRTYSDKALAARDAYREAKLLEKVREEYGPLKTERDQRQATERATAVTKQVEAAADDVMSDVMDLLDGDKAHIAAVNKAMTENPTWSAHKAAMHVRKTVIVPNLQGKATAAVVDSFNKKAAGNTANGAGSSATPAKPRDAKSLARWMEANAR